MTKQQRAKLRSMVANIALELRARGAMTTKALIEEVIDRHPELVEDAKDMLVREALGGWARKALKSERDELKSPQFALPVELSGIKLPAAIAVPDFDENEDAPLWLPTEEASFDHLEAHIKMLQGSIAADARRLHNMRQLYQYLAPIMADERRDEPIGKVLLEHAKDAA